MNRKGPSDALQKIMENRQQVAMMPCRTKADIAAWERATRKEGQVIRNRVKELKEEVARMNADKR